MNNLFNTQKSNVPTADIRNASGGKAYSLSDMGCLAKYAMTGTFNETYCSSAEEQLDKVLDLCNKSDPKFIAQLAIYSRKNGRMKDMPSVLCAYLARNNIELCKQIFSRVIDDPKMLRNFVQILRSHGAVNKADGTSSKSLGSASRNLVRKYLESLTDEQLFRADVGNKPSLADIIKIVHPKPNTPERAALYAYIIGAKPKNDSDKNHLLPLVQQFEDFKNDLTKEVPNVPFQKLTALPLTDNNWKTIAGNATFNQVRQNLNTFARHNVFNDPKLVDLIADKISDPEQVRRSKVMPYQLFTTFMYVDETIPTKIKNALQNAMEVSLENVPALEGNVYICLDVSGSMCYKVTGNRGTVSTKMRYVDVAALFASAIIRKNKNAIVIPFDTQVKQIEINPFDSVVTNAQKLAIKGGGTRCESALEFINKKYPKGDIIIYFSDNQSYIQFANGARSQSRGTRMMEEWNAFHKRNPNSKLINVDMTPYENSQTTNSKDVVAISGFSDSVFDVISSFVRQDYSSDDYWLKTISEVKI